ncbi:helix-turn-helix domain-containing protein [Hyphococcus luteus]|uniref:XRE family transcriptional regulator n=1 Tax=Hyphococcus luteus TaxID=2058213 RepID=A0A2S7K0L4_9PROT|nr:helix-turn-helix transcriptional regulator [Marinicaulis flavus]PQA86047.1 XRE family transcriptional regulator [Marinicaulis flavus]
MAKAKDRTKDRAAFMGPRLRRLRREMGMTQAVMAEDLGVSPSYIALMERNQRPMTADMLLKLAQVYDLDVASLAGNRGEEFAARFDGVMRDPLFADLELSPMDVEDVSQSYPAMAEAVIRLYTAYRDGQMALADHGDDAQDAPDPVAEARRFLSARRNSFPSIDDHGERIAGEIGDKFDGADNFEAYFRERHDLKVRRLPPDVMMGAVRRLDRHRSELVLDETLDKASRTFQLALQIAYLDMRETIDEALGEGGFTSENSERLARRALANYAAGSLMMPYRAFVKAAERRKYDVEALSRQFGASFEQICHRLTTLQKPGQEGAPFFFIRVDAAGNVSKRLDGAGFPFARHGGSCPLWSLHQAFTSPREILTQWVELPDGEKFFTIVRTVTAGGGAWGAPRVERAVALGCDEKHAHRLVYTQGTDLKSVKPTPIGVACRLCHRIDCAARAEPPIGRSVLPDDYRRTIAPFGFSDR